MTLLPSRIAPVLALSLLPACIERADAQPRPDAGRWRIPPPASDRRTRATDARRLNANLLRALLATDASVASAFHPSAAELGMDGLGRYGVGPAFGADGGVTGTSLGGGGLGHRGVAPGQGSGEGYGRIANGAPTGPRFEEVAVQEALPRWAVQSELSRAAVRTHNCLVGLGPREAIDAPVRVVVRPPTTIDAVTVEDAPEGVARCTREALLRMILGPVTAPVEIRARLRAAARRPP